MEHTQQKSIYNRLGGEPALTAAVDIFYDKIMQDSQLTPFFENTDMARQRRKQKAFLTYAFGGTDHYNGLGMRKAHEKAVAQGLNEEHFNRVAGHLTATLHELDVPQDMVDEVLAIVATTHDDVLGL